MATATISSKFQVVIPKEIRNEVQVRSGQVVQVLAKGGVITLIPDRPLAELRGFLDGMKTDGVRDKSDPIVTLVDSSGWLEFMTDGPLADRYEPHLADLDRVVTPSIVLFEVYKWIKRQRSEEAALVVAAQLAKTQVRALTTTVALVAADIGLEHGLALADSVVYATAILNEVTLVTSDGDFADLPGVVYYEKAAPQ